MEEQLKTIFLPIGFQFTPVENVVKNIVMTAEAVVEQNVQNVARQTILIMTKCMLNETK